MTRYIAIAIIALSGCVSEAPVVDTDAALVLPEPVSLLDVHQDVYDAVSAEWPGVAEGCAAPAFQLLTNDEYEYATGVCGAGRCTDCAVCESGRLSDGVVQVTGAVNIYRIAQIVTDHFAGCAGVPLDDPIVLTRARAAAVTLGFHY